MIRPLAFVLALAVAACFSAASAAQQTTPKEKEHEHPSEHPKEHPEHPKSAKKVSTEEIDKAIRRHIETTASPSGGKFPVKDEILKKTWDLELVKVHNDKLQALADGRYFACVDFKAGDGTMVDVDFFMKKDGDALVVTDTTVHKINGKARYNYQEKDGVWVRVAEKG
jgi:glucose/arabinose dehydrogenase